MAIGSVTSVRPPDAKHDAAIVFVHGFTGSGPGTWADLAPRLMNEPGLASWDGWTLTYGTSWMPDICGIWTADADLPILAARLATDLTKGALARYKALVLVAHSMGGLIVQKALVDTDLIARRTSSVILFGTPSGGLVKARTIAFWKRQLDGMAKDGTFINQLRADWTKRFAPKPPFSFLAVAGERDQFVPPESSLDPFPKTECAVVAGNHVTMIHPAADDPSVVALLVRRIVQREERGDIGDSALRAIELIDFKKIIPENLDDAEKLDKKALVRLAIALDGAGRRDDAYEVLAKWNRLDSDALGTMAGRLKRRWLLSGRDRNDAEAAKAHYSKCYELAKTAGQLTQVYYHGINLAFLVLVFEGDQKAARTQEKEVLEVCDQAEREHSADEWVDATRGEAQLVLGDEPAAFAAYRRFVGAGNDPWKVSSTYLNARTIAATLGNRDLARELGQIFGDPDP
jgi:pimeloyl-ACP methyl ester carboxylesterase